MAGLASALYAARKKINVIVLTSKTGGQSLLTDNIENYPGFMKISGQELTNRVKEQVESLKVEIREGIEVVEIAKINDGFDVKERNGEIFQARALIIASGKNPRRLNAPGEQEFTSKGVTYCSICDAPLFQGKDVAVVGGGNSGLEAAMDLTKYANKIYVLESRQKISGDELTQDKLRKTGKVEFVVNAAVKEIKGDKFVELLIYEDSDSKEQKELKVQGVFINIGHIPSTEFVKGFLRLNEKNEIIIDHQTNQTSVEGVFAAGDVTGVPFKQCIIAAGEGAKAALSAHSYLLKR